MQEGELNGYRYIYRQGKEGSQNALLLLHGTGGSERDLVGFAEEIDPEASIISLRGNVSEHGHARFFRRISEGVFDEDDIKKRAAEMSEFIRLVKEKHGLGGAKFIAVGFSNGANIASSILSLHPGALDGAILMRAMVTLKSDHGARANSQASSREASGISVTGGTASPKVLLLSGTEDQLIAAENASELGVILESLSGKGFSHVWLEAGHGLTGEDLAHAKEWLNLNFK